MNTTRTTIVAAALCSTLFWIGCGKKQAEEAAPEPVAEVAAPAAPEPVKKAAPAKQAEVLPGARDVRNALAQKNYDHAVNALLVLEGTLQTDEQRYEYAVLFQEVRDTLMDNQTSDRRAAQALAYLRAVRLGR